MFVDRRVRPAAATRNMTLSLAEELQAALSTVPSTSHHRHQQQLPCGVVLDGMIRSAGGGIAQFLIDVAELGSPDQVDPVNKFHDVVCDLAYGCVATIEPPHDDVDNEDDACNKSCCGAEQLLLAPAQTTASGDDSDSSTLLSTSHDDSDVTMTSSCASHAASVSGASDAGYDSTAVSRDELDSKKLLLNHFDRSTSVESSCKYRRT